MVPNQPTAQATEPPHSGASNAEDFQPSTRNPQTAPATLQPGGGTQSTGDQSILNNQDARIIVPGASSSAPPPRPVESNGGSSILLWVIVGIVVFLATAYFVRKHRLSQAAQPREPEIAEDSTAKSVPTQIIPQRPDPSKKKSRRKKSKSKRKKK